MVLNLKDVYLKRPFQTRNADEYDISEILKLFVNPLHGLTSPFDYENNIVKGRMGSGKTMYLRANYAYYLYRIIPSLISSEELILPVLIKLSDFQHIRDASEIYKAIIVKIVEELAGVYLELEDAKRLARIHMGMKQLPNTLLVREKIGKTLQQLIKLGSEDYTERITTGLGMKGGIRPKFFEFSAEMNKTQMKEFRAKTNPGIKDVEEAYKYLIKDGKGKILLLIDEAGSLDRTFFKGKENDSFFEILMNQLRTATYIRTKIAIYPNSYQDVLTETRYGDIVRLEEGIYSEAGYENFRKKSYEIIFNYINSEDSEIAYPEEVFQILKKEKFGDCLEQIINASNGNLRRLIQLFDATMDYAYTEHEGADKITTDHVFGALKKHSLETEGQYSEPERELLKNISQACKSRSTYKFQFPNMSIALNKFTSRSQEFNLINVQEIGAGRKGTTYAFDYCYCVAHDLPTHYVLGTEKIDKQRSLKEGQWVQRVAKISGEILQHASISNKVEGVIDYFNRDSGGFIVDDEGGSYYFQVTSIIPEDKDKPIIQGRRTRFVPFKIGESKAAYGIEIL